MAAPRLFPTSGAWRLRAVRPADVLVLLALFALLFGLLELIPSLNSPSRPQTASSTVSLDPAEIPYYAVRSLLRMFIGLALSVVFTFVYATAAGLLIYRRFEWRRLYPMLLETASLSGAILLIIGTATGMAWALTQSGFSRQLAAAMAGTSSSGSFTGVCAPWRRAASPLPPNTS